MDINEFIASGMIQDYCLGILKKQDQELVERQAALFPEIKKEILAQQEALAGYAADFSRMPDPLLKGRILATLEGLEKNPEQTKSDSHLLTRFSEKENWLRIVKPHLPKTLSENFFSKVLRNDREVFQAVLWVKDGYPDEVHEDLDESFMILEGECDCYVENNVIRLGPGDFFQVPLDVHHDVRVTRGPVLAIVQRLKTA